MFSKYPYLLLTLGFSLLAVLIKLIVLAFFYHNHPLQITSFDSFFYIYPAKSFLTTHTFLNPANTPMFDRTPGYPFFIACIFYLFGESLRAIITVQIVISMLLPVCGYFIGKRLCSEKIGFFTAIIIGSNYLLLSYNYVIMAELLFSVLITALFVFGVYIFTSSSIKYRTMLLAGLFLALATLVRPVSYFLFFPVIVLLVIYSLKLSIKKTKIILLVLTFMLPSIIFIGGWQIRNHAVVGDYKYTALMDSLGIQAFFPKNYQQYIKAHPKLKNQEKLSLIDNIRIITDYPRLTLSYFADGLWNNFETVDLHLLENFLMPGQMVYPLQDIKGALSKFQFSSALRLYEEYPKFNAVTRAYVFVLVYMNIMYLLAILGLVLLCTKDSRGEYAYAHIFLLGTMLYFILISTNSVHLPRFYLPFQTILCFYAATFFYSKQEKEARTFHSGAL